MSTKMLSLATSPGAVLLRLVLGKLEARRCLPKLTSGFLQFNAAGELVATDDLRVGGIVQRKPKATATNITTAGAGTYTAAQILNGLITRDPAGGARTDTTDTAANLISALGLTADGHEHEVTVINTADAAETITLVGGSNVTIRGRTVTNDGGATYTVENEITIAQGQSARLAVMRTSSTRVCIREV